MPSTTQQRRDLKQEEPLSTMKGHRRNLTSNRKCGPSLLSISLPVILSIPYRKLPHITEVYKSSLRK